jgi:hypothetical protein
MKTMRFILLIAILLLIAIAAIIYKAYAALKTKKGLGERCFAAP